LAVIALLTALGAWSAGRLGAGEQIDVGRHWPRVLDAHFAWILIGWLVLLAATLLPMISMAISLKRAPDPMFIWDEFSPQACGSLLIAIVSGLVGLFMALSCSARPARGMLGVGAISF